LMALMLRRMIRECIERSWDPQPAYVRFLTLALD
jgi:hypothetical protein